MSYGDEKSERNIIVASDPRIEVSQENINQVYEASKTLEGYTAVAASAVKQLVESKQTLADYQKVFKANKSDEMKELLKEIKTQTKAIDSLMTLYLGKVDKRQGIVRNPESTVMTRIRNASGYIRSRQQGITTTETKLLKHAKDELDAALNKTNKFFVEVWPELKSKVEAENASRFKEVKQIKLD
jgi:hypothetical protein